MNRTTIKGFRDETKGFAIETCIWSLRIIFNFSRKEGKNDVFPNLSGQLRSMEVRGLCYKISKFKDLTKRAKMQKKFARGKNINFKTAKAGSWTCHRTWAKSSDGKTISRQGMAISGLGGVWKKLLPLISQKEAGFRL